MFGMLGKGAMPDWLGAYWLLFAPVALLFSGRILWEKTVWTRSRGPQMVGFSLIHIHPMFFVLGMVCSLALAIWLFPGIAYAVARRKEMRISDLVMILGALIVIVALALPDNTFA
jgi:hypothetical protein